MLKTIIQNFKKRYTIKNYKFGLVVLVLAISAVGILMVNSADDSYTGRQIIGVLLGVIAMAVVSLIDYGWIMKLYWLLYAVNLVLLVAVRLWGTEVNGATRWLNLGFVQLQPSDLTKILMILFFAKFFMKHEQNVSNWRIIVEAIALLIPSLLLILKQPNLSNTICLALLFCVLIYTAGLSHKIVGTILAVIVPVAVIVFVLVIQPDQKLIDEYQQIRILAWLQPEEYESEEAYQQLNSVMAIGSGQLTGKGYNSDATTSVKNGNFILEPQTDFIFAVIGEELGFVGCCAIIILLLLIVIDCLVIGMKAKDTGGRIICAGVGSLIGIQTFINIAVATMIFPNTGISLPFVSYGQTSIVCFYIGIGLVLNVGLQQNKYQ